MSVRWYIVVSLDDFAFVLPFACDYFACALPPFSIDLLEIMGSCPLLYYSFVLLRGFLQYVRYGSASDKYLLWKYHNILVIFSPLVVVGSPR